MRGEKARPRHAAEVVLCQDGECIRIHDQRLRRLAQEGENLAFMGKAKPRSDRHHIVASERLGIIRRLSDHDFGRQFHGQQVVGISLRKQRDQTGSAAQRSQAGKHRRAQISARSCNDRHTPGLPLVHAKRPARQQREQQA